jgi:3-oxoacyl-[acyl-carrier protein] reductase
MLGGKTVLVCGASQGIGKSVCEKVLSLGANLYQVARDAEALRANAELWSRRFKGQAISTLSLDLSSQQSATALASFLESKEPIDGVVVTVGAGTPLKGDFAANLRHSLDMNLFSAVNAILGATPHFRRDSNSSVVVVGSIAGHELLDCPPEYAASKAALEMLVKHWSKLHSPVRFNSVAPGNVQTPNSVWQRRVQEGPEKLKEELELHVPMGRLGQPEEIAQVITFLLSSESSFITGSTITVDGGQQRSVR